MSQNLTDITLVVDRSGSMEAIRRDAEGGVNAFIREQAAEPGEASLTLVQFDTKYEFVSKGVPIELAPKFKLVPRGATALLDAVGRAIHETAERLAKLKHEDAPGLVLFCIVTDGLENSSQEFSKTQIKTLIEQRRQKSGWQFTFLGANQDAFAEARSMGIPESGAANYSTQKVATAYKAYGTKVSRMRRHLREGKEVRNGFSEEERRRLDQLCKSIALGSHVYDA
jgi:Mg-chelatase subunit ChlD